MPFLRDRIRALIERPWPGRCATTGHTAAWFVEHIDTYTRLDVPDWAKSAAISLCRAYGIRGEADPAYIANVIWKQYQEAGDCLAVTELEMDHGETP